MDWVAWIILGIRAFISWIIPKWAEQLWKQIVESAKKKNPSVKPKPGSKGSVEQEREHFTVLLTKLFSTSGIYDE